MKIDRIVLNNFRQYYGENTVDLQTSHEKNIVVIGGKNGYGKTNFLISLVWCFYGEDIVKIDEGFKKEVQKDGNYLKFLKSSLNWQAAREGDSRFSTEIHISDIELPGVNHSPSNGFKCRILRGFDTNSATDEFEIMLDGAAGVVLNSIEDKINFVNDYLIPLEAAKFVFFDAEKIASWAELSTKEEGSVLNDAFGKLLGLDVYEGLINDLNIYTDGLRKESATVQVKQQIIAAEKGLELNVGKIEDIEQLMAARDTEISKLKSQISTYETFLGRSNVKIQNSSSLNELYKRKNELVIKEKELDQRLGEITEIIPFVIAGGKLEEVVEHLSQQEEELTRFERRQDIMQKNSSLIEQLFNNPPYPQDGDISFSKKMFYADKARVILERIFGDAEESSNIEFEHDLSKGDRELIFDTFSFARKQSKEIFETTIDEFNGVKNDIHEVNNLIKRIELNLEDEEIIEYSTNKEEASRKLEKLIEEKGSLQNQKDSIRRENEKLNQSLQILLKKISVSEQKRRKLEKANAYIKALEDFVVSQKRSKCSHLESVILDGLQSLMHKNLFAAVRVELLPNNDGLKVLLFDNEGNIVPKESLGMGEKQIYISSLIKAILNMSVRDFPIFIDTPLGRLDHEHINNFLIRYYPNLALQVVLMATNNEIPPSRFKLVKDNVANSYLLDSNANRTNFKQGYFQSYEN